MSGLGKFITFEGGDGSGKSTQIKLLEDYLKAKKLDMLLTKEPGGTETGKEIRKLLVEGDKDKMDAIAEALLYYADRRIHLTKKIWPALEQGKWVLSDRFADSTVAYQYYGYDKRVSLEVLNNLYKLVVGEKSPDLTIIFDIDPEIGLRRSFEKASGESVKEVRFEGRDISFHKNLRQGFLEIAKQNPERCVVLDANKTVKELHQEVIRVISERFDL